MDANGGHEGRGPPPNWEPHVEEIIDLFVKQNKTLAHVMRHMEESYGFKATARQYKYRFPNLKNLKAEDWIWIGQEKERRDAMGKVSEPCLWNRALPPDRVARELGRHRADILALQARREQIENPAPERISVRTPEPQMCSPTPSMMQIPAVQTASAEPVTMSESVIGAPTDIHELANTSSGPHLPALATTADPAEAGIGIRALEQAPSVYLGQDAVQSPMDSMGGFYFETPTNDMNLGMDSGMDLDVNLHGTGNEDGRWFPDETQGRVDFSTNAPPLETFNFGVSWPTDVRYRSPSQSPRNTPRLAPRSHNSPISTQISRFTMFGGEYFSRLTVNLPWFQMQSVLESHEGLSPLSSRSPLRGSSHRAIVLSAESRHGVLGNLLGAEDVVILTEHLRRSLPLKHGGHTFDNISQLLDPQSTGASGLKALFNIAAYFASNCKLPHAALDTFLKWVEQEGFASQFEQFLQLNTPTTRVFVAQLRLAAMRVKNARFLNALLERGISFEDHLREVYLVKDANFTKLVLSKADDSVFKRQSAAKLFHCCVEDNDFDLAKSLVERGVPVDCIIDSQPDHPLAMTALFNAAFMQHLARVEYLLKLGANVNHDSFEGYPPSLLPTVVSQSSPSLDLIRILLKNGANTKCMVYQKDILTWTLENYPSVHRLLLRHFEESEGVERPPLTGPPLTGPPLTGDTILAAAMNGDAWLKSFVKRHKPHASNLRALLKFALVKAAKNLHEEVVLTLLQCEAGAGHPEVFRAAFYQYFHRGSSKETARISRKKICQLLVNFGADANVPGILGCAAWADDLGSMEILIDSGLRIEEQGVGELVVAAEEGHLAPAAFLLRLGVDINGSDHRFTPLQAAVSRDMDSLSQWFSNMVMVEYLVSCGADINAPAVHNGGRTALQAALGGPNAAEIGSFLLDHGADVSAPPAPVDGVTSLEAIFSFGYSWHGIPNDHVPPLVDRLVRKGATIDRPDGKPSSALHRCIFQNKELLPRLLNGRHTASIDFMWCDPDREEYTNPTNPRTPLQFAVEEGYRHEVELLLEMGADINALPAISFGRTALQAALTDSAPDLDLVQFLIEKGADIHAEPAVEGGITALQGAAISGDIKIALMLLEMGVDVNARGSFKHGRYAIEGAAEHGRLDMVQLLLNAGAKGNVTRGTGLAYAIELARENGHGVIVDILKEAAQCLNEPDVS